MDEVHVAVGVVLDTRQRVLLSLRDEGAHQGGLWEFPGGKVERDEGVVDALARELREELGIRIGTTVPLIKIRHDYGDKRVFLDVHVVSQHHGEARGLESQPLQWVDASALPNYDFPAANVPIITAVQQYLNKRL